VARTLVERLVDELSAAIRVQLREQLRREKRNSGEPTRRGRPRRRKLDMRCRVKGCKNLSKGPRYGFICNKHRAKLSKKQQQAARDAWNAKAA